MAIGARSWYEECRATEIFTLTGGPFYETLRVGKKNYHVLGLFCLRMPINHIKFIVVDLRLCCYKFHCVHYFLRHRLWYTLLLRLTFQISLFAKLICMFSFHGKIINTLTPKMVRTSPLTYTFSIRITTMFFSNMSSFIPGFFNVLWLLTQGSVLS